MAMINFTALVLLLSMLFSVSLSAGTDECHTSALGECYDKAGALRLKLIAIPTILVSSVIGVSLPLFSRSLPALRPDRDLFVVVKAFASGVILATGYMHVLPDSFADLQSPCLNANPWHKFPFTTFVAMVSALLTLTLDSLMMTFYNGEKRKKTAAGTAEVVNYESPPVAQIAAAGGLHGHSHGAKQEPLEKERDEEALKRNRVIVQVLEMGIVVHSVVIGLGVGASMNPCSIRPLVAALCFHQLFEGMGLGGCILQAEYGGTMKSILVFFFSTTTPFGIALGIGLSKVYKDNSPTALIVVGILNACSAGLLNYTALVDLLAADFFGPKLQSSVKLQLIAFAAVFLGAGGMAVMAKWA